MKFFINFFSKLGVDFFTRAIGLVTLPIITRGLGPDRFGEFIFITVVSSYFGLFIDFGYFLYATNQISKFPDQFETIVNKVLSLRLLTAIVSYLLVLSSLVFFDVNTYSFLILYSLVFFTQVFKIDFYHISINRLYYNSFSELIGQLVFLFGIILFFSFYKSVTVLIILTLLQSIITASFSLAPFLRNAKLKLSINFSTFLEIFSNSYKLGFAQKFEFITSSSVILFIGFLLSKQDIGYFSAAFKIYAILITIVAGISYTLMSDVFRSIKSDNEIKLSRVNKLFYVYLSSGFVLGFFTTIFAPQIIKIFFGVKFINSVIILTGFGFTISLWPVIMFIGLIFISYNKQAAYVKSALLTAIMTIIFTYIFIVLFGFKGTAFIFPSVAVSSLLVNLFLLNKVIKEKNIKMSELFSFLTFVKTVNSYVIRTKKLI